MNSAERRRLNRATPNSVSIHATSLSGIAYFEYDDRMDDAVRWCKKNCHRSYRVIRMWDNTEFKFELERDAVVFALNWV